jgi:hypothetical protein
MALLVATPAEKKPAAPKPAAAPAAQASKGSGVKLLVGLGVMVALVVGVVLLWNGFRARMEAKMQGQGGEERLTGELPVAPPPPKDPHRVREVGLPQSQVVESDDDDLSAPEKKHKPKPPPPLPVNAPPAERAWRSLKTDFERLQSNNETTAKKYRMRYMTLDDQRKEMPEAQLVKEAGGLDEQIRAELAKPENQ